MASSTGWRWAKVRGALAGFTSFVAHAGGPPANAYLLPQRLDKTVFVGMPVFALDYSILPIAAAVVGGPGTLAGATLGACILEFVLNSCRLRGIPVERLGVEMAYREVPRPRRIGEVEAMIHLEPDPPDEVKRRLVGVARHATLTNTLVRPREVDITFSKE